MGSSEGDGYKLKCEKDNNVQLAALFEIENGVEDAEKGDLLVEVETDPKQHILYSARDHPPIYLTIFFGFQVKKKLCWIIFAKKLLISFLFILNWLFSTKIMYNDLYRLLIEAYHFPTCAI